MEDLEQLFRQLSAEGLEDWANQLRDSTTTAVEVARHGHLPKWQAAIDSMPSVGTDDWDATQGVVTFHGQLTAEQRFSLRDGLFTLHPWRKGPFDLFGVEIDAEWRSDLKWNRVAPHVDLVDQDVIDVGCGNGYYGWRMLEAGARRVVGLEPYLLYVMQHTAIKRCSPATPNYVVPASDGQLPAGLRAFDVAFSMGVFYHSKNPIGHLQSLRESLRPKGQLVLETIVIEGGDDQVLVPRDRYAKMRNVWFIPSTALLACMLKRAGFEDIKTIDVSLTCPRREQRSTPWMTFESLFNFLDPLDNSRTVEGYPAPRRAIVTSKRGA